MKQRLLICADLDRTVLPNGTGPESPEARPCFARVVARDEVSLAYVTGRSLELAERAIRDFSIPRPQFLIGEVGTAIYRSTSDGWDELRGWRRLLSGQWPPASLLALRTVLADLRIMRPQGAAGQGDFKFSYHCAPDTDADALVAQLERCLARPGMPPARVVFSRDEMEMGLIDIVPVIAGKLGAIRFLIQDRGFERERTIFAGDSGNDLDVLVSDLPGVLVANAGADVRKRARDEARRAGHLKCLYLARGGLLNMNGNYSAGILEGLVHFFPETRRWIQ